ncbi:MAG TPA: PP2C family protein-serine/threonine phosphatase [Thermoanaerobaculia bacterium]|nr:PP2C family protein-serine/threonine phosphatase [Thermoanaerobaculia bacterium]
MAYFRDWLDLGKKTFQSLSPNDMTGLYVFEWPETKRMLIADHRLAIEQEPRRLRRWLRILGAIFYGLTKRLAPHRRVLFFIAQIGFYACLISIFTSVPNPPVWVFVEIAVTFLLMTLLLAMELIDKIKIRDELVLARDLQASLIPKELPQTPRYEFAAYNRIANTVGGDIYDFVPLPDGRTAILFGDASGHGMAAGLVMAVAHAAFRTQLDVDPSPAAITSSLNRILCRTGGPRSFFSCCYVLLSPDGRFVATVAGHPQILKFAATGEIGQRIGRGAYPLGVKNGLAWQELRGALVDGEHLLLHSDGLSEARNAAEKEFGYTQVEIVGSRRPGRSAQELLDDLVGELRSFMNGHPIEDDVSIAVIRKR